MSSGCGTQQNDSKDEPTYADSIELHTIYPTNLSTHDVNSEAPILQRINSDTTNPIYLNYTYNQGLLDMPIYRRQSGDNISTFSKHASISEKTDRPIECVSPMSQTSKLGRRSINESITRHANSIRRLSSDQSINTLSNEHEDVFTQPNLRDELLNCDQKELFQFLNDDFDTSHNYFSDTVGYGSAIIDPDTDSLILDSKKDEQLILQPRKTSTTSNKSNLSYISNSIFETLEQKRGGSISETIDRMATNQRYSPYVPCDESNALVPDSEFENIIASFEKELTNIKNSTQSLERNLSTLSRASEEKTARSPFEKSSSTHTYEEILPMRTNICRSGSIKLKRRSLEKQMKVDDDFTLNEIRKASDPGQRLISDNSPSNANAGNANSNSNIVKISPVMRRKNDFHSSFDRIKRTSLIERVDETIEDEKPGHYPYSDTLPRKYLNPDMNIESISLKSTGSYEHLIYQGEGDQKKLRFEHGTLENEQDCVQPEEVDEEDKESTPEAEINKAERLLLDREERSFLKQGNI